MAVLGICCAAYLEIDSRVVLLASTHFCLESIFVMQSRGCACNALWLRPVCVPLAVRSHAMPTNQHFERLGEIKAHSHGTPTLRQHGGYVCFTICCSTIILLHSSTFYAGRFLQVVAQASAAIIAPKIMVLLFCCCQLCLIGTSYCYSTPAD